MACNCRVCNQSRRIKRTVQNGSRQQFRRLVNELVEEIEAESTDAAVSNSILEGHWPDSVSILRDALARAEAYEKMTPQERDAFWEAKKAKLASSSSSR